MLILDVNLTFEVSCVRRTEWRGINRASLCQTSDIVDCIDRRDKPRIIAIGLLTFRIPFMTKYGISPCSLFRFASVSDAESVATSCWKIVEASLLKVRVSGMF